MPQAGTALRREPLDIIRGQMGATGLFVVADMRYFEGPELPNILEPRPPVVKRWYVKASLQARPSFRGRWVVEKRTPVVKGISGVAPFDTHGFESPDWRAFEGGWSADVVPGPAWKVVRDQLRLRHRGRRLWLPRAPQGEHRVPRRDLSLKPWRQ